MSRLLHAAARGARIQSQWRDAHTPTYQEWQTNNQFVFIDTMRHYRIHPNDEHLQYGPVSTALRDCDGDFQWVQIDWSEMPDLAIRSAIVANYAYNMIDEWRQTKDRLTRSLFLLILAEALADEGM